MPRKRSSVFHNLLKARLSLVIHKWRKVIIPKLHLLLKKLRKPEELRLLRHYSYGEYQFSASSTPLIHGKKRAFLCSFLYVYRCLGNLEIKLEEEFECECEYECGWGDEDDSVDEKAERFIQSFYQQIRMQRQESL